jgi:hypothetical protein
MHSPGMRLSAQMYGGQEHSVKAGCDPTALATSQILQLDRFINRWTLVADHP